MELENTKPNKKLVALLGIVIIIPILILSIIKFTPTNKDITKFNNLLKEIESCNVSLSNAINDDAIDSEEAEALLTSGMLKFNNLKDELRDISVTEKNSVLRSKLYETLDYNEKVFGLALSLLKNPNDKNISTKFTDYSKTYELLLKNYENLKLSGLKADFPEEAKKFVEASSSFTNTILKLNREKDIKTTQQKEYLSNIKTLLDSFDEIDQDLEPALNKIKEDGRSLEVLLKDIKDKKSKFNELKNKSYSLSIPEEGNECYSLLQDTLNYYDLYITSLEHSIIIENSSNETKENEYINENYANCFSKYKDFIENLDLLRKEVKSFDKT